MFSPEDRAADDFFREDAARLGYTKDDPHEPGNGRGLAAYYRDHGFHPSTWEPVEPILRDEDSCE